MLFLYRFYQFITIGRQNVTIWHVPAAVLTPLRKNEKAKKTEYS
jgi:hypothetical protein